jgi:peptidoglycan/LPS O-acetylase OafA/YrhL
VFAGNNEVWREYSYLGSMDAIALGCLTALFCFRYGPHLGRTSLRWIGATGALLLLFSLGFSLQGARLGLERPGLSMTIVAAGACMVMVAAAQTKWQSPRLLSPLRILGQRSYEVYLTHMFVVVAIFGLYALKARPLSTLPLLFVTIIVCAGGLGEVVARLYSEPINRLLRARWGASRQASATERIAS